MALWKYSFIILHFIILVFLWEGDCKVTRERRVKRDRKPIPELKRSKFKCLSGEMIESTYLCDGISDCRDGCDESTSVCISRTCPPEMFRCGYGGCIEVSYKCDGVQDCRDNSDELLPECLTKTLHYNPNSTCGEDEFKCKSGQCIEKIKLCDAKFDCDDHSDETIAECIETKCNKRMFQCTYGACIPGRRKCNNRKDCPDGSDEELVLCSRHQKKSTKKPSTTSTTSKPITTVSPFKNGCVLPERGEGLIYKVNCLAGEENSDKCRGVVGTPVEPFTIISFSCQKNLNLSTESSHSFCINSIWQPPVPTCLKKCPPLITSSTDVSCKYGGVEVSCEIPLSPGTVAKQRCKNAYVPLDPINYKPFNQSVCLDNGVWSIPPFRCKPECGRTNEKVVKPLISYGMSASSGEYPWNVGLYNVPPLGNITHICGGSLITSFAVLTAAHCVYDELKGCAVEERTIKVAVGKYHRDWYTPDPYEQKRDVREIVLARAYRGAVTAFVQDIAVLGLVSPVTINNAVLPICIDWNSKFFIKTGDISTAVGWGYTENKEPSNLLQVAHLPIYLYEDCINAVSKQFARFITYDKFCAGYMNGTSVQQGDSGGGLSIVLDGLHLVIGLVSIKERSVVGLSAFTNVTEHLSFITKTVLALRQQMVDQFSNLD